MRCISLATLWLRVSAVATRVGCCGTGSCVERSNELWSRVTSTRCADTGVATGWAVPVGIEDLCCTAVDVGGQVGVRLQQALTAVLLATQTLGNLAREIATSVKRIALTPRLALMARFALRLLARVGDSWIDGD